MKIKGAFPVRWTPSPGKDGKGVTVTSSAVKYAASTSGTDKPGETSFKADVPAVADGCYLWTWVRVEYSDGTKTDSYSVSRMGVDGKGIKSSAVTYSQQATSVDPAAITDWGGFPSTLTDGYWLYTKTHIVYSDGSATDSYSVSQVGVGSYYAGVAEYYAAGASAAAEPEGAAQEGTYVNGQEISTTWTQARPALTAETPYLWNFEISSDSRGNRYVTAARCIGNFAKGIVSIVETYAISAYGAPNAGGDYPDDIATWSDEHQDAVPTEAKPYQWNKTVTTYNDGSSETRCHVSAVKGLDGKGAVYLDLDNENDTMLYDEKGNLVGGSASGFAKSNITLYANGEAVGAPPGFKIDEKSPSVGASVSGSVLTVSSITSDTGYVVVSCVYNGVKHTARMTLKRLVGVDKYELVVNPGALTYNETQKTLSGTEISVEVYRTAQNGSRTKVTAMSAYSLTAKLYPNGVSTDARDITFNTSGNGTASVTAAEAAEWTNFAVALLKDGEERDRETVPVNKVKDGATGPGAVILDLDNENDSMLYDGADNAVSDPVVSTGSLYMGPLKVNNSQITWSIASAEGCALMDGGKATSATYGRDTNPNAAWISTDGVVTVNGMTASQGKVTVRAAYGGNTYDAALTLKKLRGVDKYELVVNPGALTYNTTTRQVNGGASATVTAEVWRTAQNGERAKVTDYNAGNAYNLSLSVTPDAGTVTVTKQPYGCTFSVDGNLAAAAGCIAVTLRKGAVTHDSETVPIAKTTDGSGGSPGPGAKAIYRLGFAQPATPEGASPQGEGALAWHDDPYTQDSVRITQQGDWYRDADGFMRAPLTGTAQSSVQTLSFNTSAANRKVYLRVRCSLGEGSYVRIGKVDAVSPSSDYLLSVSGADSDTGEVEVDVENAGSHFICVCHHRGTGTDTYAKFRCGRMDVWQSNAKAYSAAGAVTEWSAPFKAGSDTTEETVQTRGNILRQTAFTDGHMDAWHIRNGATTDGMDGRNAYACEPDYGYVSKEALGQKVYETGGDKPLLPGTWYTLSFWAKADPYIHIDKNLTSHKYGFGQEAVYLQAGARCTLLANGCCSAAAIAAGRKLAVRVYNATDTWSESVSVETVMSTTAGVTFDVPSTGLYCVEAYDSPTGAGTDETVTLNWIRIDRGMRMAARLYAPKGTGYTCLDTEAGLLKDGADAANTLYGGTEWQLTEVWARHSVTFKTAEGTLPDSDQTLLFLCTAGSNKTYVCMPKLEQGTQATSYTGNDDDIAAMAIEDTGFPNDRGEWVESPQEPYVWTDTRRDYVAYAVDEEWKRYFVKRKGMTVPDGTPPAKGGNSYWEEGSRISTLLVNTLVAAGAEMTFAKSNRILVTGSGGEVAAGMGGAEDGDDYPLWIGGRYEERAGAPFRVTLDGKMHATGAELMGKVVACEEDGAEKQRLVLDPASKSLVIYDDDNEMVSVFEGKAYGGISSLFNNESGSFAMSGDKDMAAAETLGLSSKTVTSSGTLAVSSSAVHTSTPTEITVGGTLQAKAFAKYTSQSSPRVYAGEAYARVLLRVVTYGDTALSSKVSSTEAMSLTASAEAYSIAPEKEDFKSKTFSGVKVKVPAGYHVLEVYYTQSAAGDGSYAQCAWGAQCALTAAPVSLSASYSSDFYVSRFFANGFVVGLAADDYVCAYNGGDDGMHFAAENNGYGVSVSRDGVRLKLGGAWKTVSVADDGTLKAT